MIFVAAGAGIEVLRHDAAEVRRMRAHLEHVQLNVTELSSLEAHAVSVNRVSLRTRLRTDTLIKGNDVEYALFEPLAREKIPAHRHDVEEIGR